MSIHDAFFEAGQKAGVISRIGGAMSYILLSPEEIVASWGAHPTTGDTHIYEGIARAQARKVHQWGEEICPHMPRESYMFRLRRECGLCWEDLRREVGLE